MCNAQRVEVVSGGMCLQGWGGVWCGGELAKLSLVIFIILGTYLAVAGKILILAI